MASSKAPPCLGPALRSRIHCHDVAGKDARYHINFMSPGWFLGHQPRADFGSVFLELTVLSVSIPTLLHESFGVIAVLCLQARVCCETAGRGARVSATCTPGSWQHRLLGEPLFPLLCAPPALPGHPFVPNRASRLQFSATKYLDAFSSS